HREAQLEGNGSSLVKNWNEAVDFWRCFLNPESVTPSVESRIQVNTKTQHQTQMVQPNSMTSRLLFLHSLAS
ncbi:MAG: hypothetical protein P8X79_17385, partial [Reinekea sp.]